MRSLAIISCLLTAATISLAGAVEPQLMVEADGSSGQDCGTLKAVCMGSRDPGDTLSVVIVAKAENAPVAGIEIGHLLYPACLTPLEVFFFNEAYYADTVGWSYEAGGSISCEDTNIVRIGILFSFDADSSRCLHPEVGEQSLAQIDFEIRTDASIGVYPLFISEAEFVVSGAGSCEPTIEIVDSIRVDIRLDDETAARTKSFSLYQNVPNPFNEHTKIGFVLAENCPVTLEIYNLQGQKVSTLIDGQHKAGHSSVCWDAGSFPSGLYFIRLQADDFVETRKMILLR